MEIVLGVVIIYIFAVWLSYRSKDKKNHAKRKKGFKRPREKVWRNENELKYLAKQKEAEKLKRTNANTKKEIYKGYSVYALVNSKNRKVYIGMTNNYERREKEHFDFAYRIEHKKLLYKYMREIGEKEFQMIELVCSLTKKEAQYVEATLIKAWGTVYPYGYNVSDEIDHRSLGYNVKKYNGKLFDEVKEFSKLSNKPKYMDLEVKK